MPEPKPPCPYSSSSRKLSTTFVKVCSFFSFSFLLQRKLKHRTCQTDGKWVGDKDGTWFLPARDASQGRRRRRRPRRARTEEQRNLRESALPFQSNFLLLGKAKLKSWLVKPCFQLRRSRPFFCRANKPPSGIGWRDAFFFPFKVHGSRTFRVTPPPPKGLEKTSLSSWEKPPS